MSAQIFQGMRFLMVGAFNTLIGISIIFIAKWMFNFDDLLANILGYAIGLFVSFTFNKRWTFNYNGNFIINFYKFTVSFLVAYATNIITVLALKNFLLVNSYYAQLLGVIPYTCLFYLLCKFFVFKN